MAIWACLLVTNFMGPMRERSEEEREYHAILGRMASLAMAEKAGRGELVCRPPLGYRQVLRDGEKAVVPDEETAPLVRKAFMLASTGQHSVRGMLEILSRDGLLSPGGKEISPSTLWNVLRNPFYAGYLRYKGRLIKGVHEPIVDIGLYEAVGAKLAHKRRR